MADILAIVSKAYFEEELTESGELHRVGDVYPTRQYVSTNKTFHRLAEGDGRIFLVTVRFPGEQLWLVGVIENPKFDGDAWVGQNNTRRITDITTLRKRILFENGKGLSQNEGALAMSLQTPRVLSTQSAADILALCGGESAASEQKSVPAEEPAKVEARRSRERALDEELDRFVVLYDRMQEVWGLRLPKSLAYGVGFIKGLLPEERAEFDAQVGKLIGVGAWFEQASKPIADERLRDRVLDDPPEFVPVFETISGNRWGLWYDDPDELPTGFAERTATKSFPFHNTSHEVWESHFLGILQRRGLERVMLAHRATIDEWRQIALTRQVAHVKERCPVERQRSGWLVGESMNPWLGDDLSLPFDWLSSMSYTHRWQVYENDRMDVERWIEQALVELNEGSPGRALFLGRELHSVQVPRWRYACTELLMRAYSVLDRKAFVEVVRVAYSNADPSAKIFELPPTHALVTAAVRGDIAELEEAFGEEPSADDLNEALGAVESVEALDALLDRAAATTAIQTDTALWRKLQLFIRATSKDKNRHRKLVVRLLERGQVSARAFEALLRAGDEELMVLAAKRIDLASTFRGELSPLHLAARRAIPAVVKTLLGRGADPKAKNAEGRMPYDAAREAQEDNDPNALEIMTLLQNAGGGMAKPQLPASDELEYCEGDTVHHKKLGDGVVESVTGEGEEAKLKIRFETETKTFLAKFVTPVARS